MKNKDSWRGQKLWECNAGLRHFEITTLIVTALVLLSPFFVSAQTITNLQGQIRALLNQISTLQQNPAVNPWAPPPPTGVGTSSMPIYPLNDDYPGVTPPPNTCPNLFTTIQRGARDITTGGQVSELQVFLADQFGLDEENIVTGYFGKLTQKYVIQFQQKHGLPAYGIVGSLTRAKIKEVCGGVPPSGAPISVTVPNGGEQWEIDTLNTVTWTPYSYNPDVNPSRDVTAYLERLVGACNGIGTDCGIYETLGKVQESGKASIHWYAGELNSASGPTLKVPEGQYYIRVVNNVTGSSDRSDGAFSLVSKSVDLKINGQDGPAHGGQFIYVTQSSPLTVTWKVRNGSNCSISGLALKPDVHVTEAQSVPVSGSSGERTMYPVLTPPGVGYPGGIINGVSMTCTNSAGVHSTDYVQIDLSEPSSTSSLNVVSPNGGEQINLGAEKMEPVQYKYVGMQNVSVALYRNDQWVKWIVKEQPTNPNGSNAINWWVSGNDIAPTDLGKNIFKIYVTGQKADGSGYIDDKSDAPFTFVSGTGTRSSLNIVASPTKIEQGGNATITWEVFGSLGNCFVDGPPGTRFGNGQRGLQSTGALTKTTTYTLGCDNTRETKQVVVAVSPQGPLATLNPNDKASGLTLGSGNLGVNAASQITQHQAVRATLGMSSNKWYWEVFVSNGPGSQGNVNLLGVMAKDALLTSPVPGGHGFAWGYGTEIGLFYPSGFSVNASFAKDVSGLPKAPPLSNGWKRFAYDADSGKLWVGDNAEWFGGGDPAAGTNPTATYISPEKKAMYPAASLYHAHSAIGFAFNFGQTPFQVAPPEGFKMLGIRIPQFEEASVQKNTNLANAFSALKSGLKSLRGILGR